MRFVQHAQIEMCFCATCTKREQKSTRFLFSFCASCTKTHFYLCMLHKTHLIISTTHCTSCTTYTIPLCNLHKYHTYTGHNKTFCATCTKIKGIVQNAQHLSIHLYRPRISKFCIPFTGPVWTNYNTIIAAFSFY